VSGEEVEGAATRRRGGKVLHGVESIGEWLLRVFGPLLERFVAVAFIQSAVVLAAQAFMALFPLVICVIAFAPSTVGQTISNEARNKIGLSGATGTDVQNLVASRDALRNSLSIIGVLVVFVSATSFTRALQRVYQNAWELPKAGIRASIFGLEWLVGLAAYLALLAGGIELTSGHHAGLSVLRVIILVAFSFFLWWLTPFVLLCGRVRLRALLVTGALSAVALLIAGAVSAQIMPRIIGSNERKYGTIGVVFAVESWLVVIASVIVTAGILGAFGAQSGGRLGDWARGSADREAWRRIKPPRPSKLAKHLKRLTTSAKAEQSDPDRERE
jgi:membrane protein